MKDSVGNTAFIGEVTLYIPDEFMFHSFSRYTKLGQITNLNMSVYMVVSVYRLV